MYVSLESLHQITVDGEIRADAERLKDVFTVVIWFLVICSIVRSNPNIPFTCIPLNVSQSCAWTQRSIGKIGYHLPRTLSSAIASRSMNQEDRLPLLSLRTLADS